MQVDPKILKQLSGVKDFKDFVKKFQPKGFTVIKQTFLKKVSIPKGKVPNKPVIGIGGGFGTSIDLSHGLPGE